MVTRSMVKATATTLIKTTTVVVSSQSCDDTDSNMLDEVRKIQSVNPLKGKSISELKRMPQSSFFEVEDYCSSDSSAPSSTRTIIMPSMIIGAVNFEEKLANMKATFERQCRERHAHQAPRRAYC